MHNKPGSVLKVIRGQQGARLNPYKLQTCMHDLYAVTLVTKLVKPYLAKQCCSVLLAQAHPTAFYIYTSIW